MNSPILGGLVHRLAAEQPEAQVSTYGSWSAEELARMVLGGRLDFALCGTCGESVPSTEAGMAWRAVSVDPVFVMLPETHRLAARPEIALADLAGEQWAVARGDGCFGDCFGAACLRAGFTPRTNLRGRLPRLPRPGRLRRGGGAVPGRDPAGRRAGRPAAGRGAAALAADARLVRRGARGQLRRPGLRARGGLVHRAAGPQRAVPGLAARPPRLRRPGRRGRAGRGWRPEVRG